MASVIAKADGWKCPVECSNIPLITIAMIMNEFNITAEEYMSDREKWLIKSGVWEDKNG